LYPTICDWLFAAEEFDHEDWRDDYYEGMDSDILRLSRIMDTTPNRLSAIDEAHSEERRIEGKWCAKEVLGHLIDSASNNHQRFVRGQLAPSYEGPSYTQNE